MIRIFNNIDRFEYDIRGLVMAFYPGENMVYNDQTQPEAEDFSINIEWSEGNVSVSVATETVSQSFTEGEAVYAKTAVKDALYILFSRLTGKTLPWGTLTGIRPTKIPMAMLENGAGDEEILRHMEDELLVSPEKSLLALDIARREKSLLEKLDYDRGYSLYIGIPFCPSRCLYCSFTAYPISVFHDQVDSYLDCLEKELMFTAEFFRDRKLNTVYVGGGTPTTLLPYQIDRLCDIVEKNFDLSDLLEFTIEAGRPDSLDEEKLSAIKRHRVDRISINPQTMKQETLDIIGRYHRVEDVVRVFKQARSMGFDNINMDLIMGLPDESIDDVRHTMEEIKKLGPDNLTVHSLAIKRSSRLNLEREKYASYAYENTSEQMELTARYAAEMGLKPYYLYRQKNMAGNFENVGYAADGKAGIYNILIMEEKQSIVACGAGATSKAVFKNGRIERAENVKDIKSYFERIDEMIDRKRALFSQE
ncbi:MAG: coproporphyrinogen dehydrogenase HemZ [Lachnospiraceae bacterium]|nr:coproporphyrinogen dehydrogenase HemZ [Lachnospiraceae bacterium]